MSLLCCPVCGGALEQGEKTYRCGRGHSFDRASSGYVNLLPPRAKPPGDNAQMVAARAQFLAEGYYDPLREALGEGTLLSVELTAQQVLSGGDSGAGIDLARVLPLVDRRYIAGQGDRAELEAAVAPLLDGDLPAGFLVLEDGGTPAS